VVLIAARADTLDGGLLAVRDCHDELAGLTSSHPALIDSAARWRGVGGWGAVVTVLRAVEVGAISIGLEHGSIELRLVPGVATSRRSRHGGPYVEHGHVEGMSGFDRQLLSVLFDEIAHAPETTVAQLAAFSRAHPLEFWNRLREWRGVVDSEASRLRSGGRLAVTRERLDRARSAIIDLLHDESLSDREWSRMAGVALVAGLDDMVVKTAGMRMVHGADAPATGPAGVIRLACLVAGRRSGVDVMRRLFSPLRPSSYSPAQYVTLVMPPDKRPRIIDDGSLRLGG